MTLDQAVEQVQLTYPQVHYACHTRHQRKRSTDHRLSQRDTAILAHLSPDAPRVPTQLARHLAIARSTLSEALKKLQLLDLADACRRYREVASSKGGTR